MSSSAEEPIVLQVGECRFTTTVSTLTEHSTFFKAKFSGRWANQQLTDSSYFLDADPAIFEHVLRYFRCGVMPLLWKSDTGFDIATYVALGAQARYLGVEKLEKWIAEQNYKKAVLTKFSAMMVTKSAEDMDGFTGSFCGWAEQRHYPSWRTESVYQCPRGISQHEGKPSACGKACAKAQGDEEAEYLEKPVLTTLIVTKTVALDPTQCSSD